MKKILLFCIIAFCFHITVSAQKSRVGFSGGASFSNMNSQTDGQKTTGDSRPGIMFGLIVETPINKLLSFQPGVYYVQKGMNFKPSQNPPGKEISIALRYVEFNMNFL